MSSTSTINMVTNSTNLHKVNTNLLHPSSTTSQDSSTSSTAIYIDDSTIDSNDNDSIHNTHIHNHTHNHLTHTDHNFSNKKMKNVNLIQNNHYTINELTIIDNDNNNKYNQRVHNYKHNGSLFGHDYIKNFVILSKLYSPQEFYNLPISLNKSKIKGSDCPSDISSIDSHRTKRKHKNKTKIRKLISWIKYINSTICDIIKFSCDFIILSFNKFQKWQKELHEAPIEVKEKYFFVVSTIISTILFYILFLCLDIMIRYWFALPKFITDYSFSISYCISYLTSVIWQHFFNQYFVFSVLHTTPTQTTDTFCDSLFRTYLVYGCSLMMTGIIGSILQIYVGIADEFILFLTLPISGIMNYYLLRYCHNKHNSIPYQLLPNDKYNHSHRKNKGIGKIKSARHTYKKYNKKHTNIDDIVIV